MTDFTVTGAGDVLDYLIEGNAVTGAGALYIGLFTGDPGTDGTPANEVTTAGPSAYTRQPLVGAFTVDPALRVATSNADITWNTATATWSTVSHIAICNTGTVNTAAGSILFHTAISNVTVGNGDQAKISLGNLTLTLN
jgi:hypothetical protein